MNEPPTLTRTRANMYIAGGIILTGAILYLLFLAVDGLGLSSLTATARVIGKEIRQAGRSYTTQLINSQPYTLPQVTPEMFLLKLDLAGRKTVGAARKLVYDAVREGDTVSVTYQKRRLTGRLHVVEVAR